MKWKETGYKFMAYPVCAFVVYLGFVLLISMVLPWVNTMGTSLYQLDEVKLYTFYLLPFTALDTVLLIGYFKICGKYCPRFCLWVRDMPGQVKVCFRGIREGLKQEKIL